jgi:anti-sigma B factor antagonist
VLKIDHDQDGVAIVAFEGRLDSSSSRDFGEQLLAVIRGGATRIVVDLARVVYISSAGFRSLLIAGKAIDEAAGKLALCSLNSEVRRLFELGAFIDLFVICASRDEGIAHAR